jgi:hypothetical protein
MKSHSIANAALSSVTIRGTSSAAAERIEIVFDKDPACSYRVSFRYLIRCG